MKNKKFDPIRKKDLLLLPEEKVRQSLISHMIHDLGYPQGYLAIEKGIDQFLKNKKISKRRIDIICFYKKKEELKPLLIIECKKDKITNSAIEQIVGYNYFIKAPFFALVAKEEIKTFWYEKKGYNFVNFLPKFKDLKKEAIA